MPSKSTSFWMKRFGFYFAALGLGVGLGNLWRFPYVVYENGGGAFVFLYMVLAFVIAFPLLVSEVLVGKISRKPILGSLRSSSGKADDQGYDPLLRYTGAAAVFVCFMVLAYYAVISGWVMHFFMQFFIGFFDDQYFRPEGTLAVLRESSWLQILLASVHLIIAIIIVTREDEEENEKWVGYVMPVFILLVLGLAYKSLSLDSSVEAIRFMFYPDFSKLTLSSPAQALGHLLFTLSVGFGAMVTFGNYLDPSDDVPGASLRVTVVDTIVSLLAGLLIFPLVMGVSNLNSGPELLFQTVPVFLGQIGEGPIYGVLFFLCLYIAALGSSIGLLETVVANLRAYFGIKRTTATWAAGFVCLAIACIPALSNNYLSEYFVSQGGVLKFIDNILVNWTLPILALVVSQVVRYKFDEKLMKKEFQDDSSPTSKTVYTHWRFILKWIVPPTVVVFLFLQALDLVV